jgi:4-amino-4-deoxy-L-arabinose transferase-like glycosyltransferase
VSLHLDPAVTITEPTHTLEAPQPDTVFPASSRRPRTTQRERLVRAVRAASVQQRFLALLLVIFLFKGIIIAFVFPPYTGHDEVAHYAYLQILAEQGRVPLIPDLEKWRNQYERPGYQPSFDRMSEEFYFPYARYTTPDWFSGHQIVAYAVTFEGEPYPSGWVYTGNHPPLFYLLLTPVFWFLQHTSIETQLYVFRMATIPLGMLTVLFAYLTVRTIFPRDRFLAMTVPAFVAFQPQIAYESAMLNNDILAIMFTSAVIWMLVLGLRRRFPIWDCLLIGLFFGLAMLSKSTSVTSAALIAFAMVFGLGLRNIREWLPKGFLTAGIAGLLVWPWLFYMWSTYGDLSALGRIETLQWWNYGGGEGRSIWSMLSDPDFFWERWRETWGAFGWRLIQLDTKDPTLLRVLLWVTLFATIGLAVYALRFLREQRAIDAAGEAGEDIGHIRHRADETLAIMPWQVTAVVTMGITCVLAYYAILQFGTTFSLTQARYYFPAIVPAAILFMLGVRSWFPRTWLPYVGAVTFLGLVGLNLLIYTAYVIPYWNQSV